MAMKPSKPSGDFELRAFNYSEDGTYEKMTDNEFRQGRNNTGEVETPLGSLPNAHKDNYLFQYITQQLSYLTQMVEYLDEKVGG